MSLQTDLEEIERHIHALNWVYEIKQVTIQKFHELRDYTHIHLHQTFDIELSVHKCFERRVMQRSSTDGKAIVRVKTNQLRQMIQDEHPKEWEEFLHTGTIDALEHYEDDGGLSSLGEHEKTTRH